MKNHLVAAVGAVSLLASATPAHALTFIGSFAGNDCGGRGGFRACHASATGVSQVATPGSSAVVFKYGFNGVGNEVSSNFTTVTGDEFAITYTGGAANSLSFTYTAGADDPGIHYVAVKQANGLALFYDDDPITSGSFNLTDFFPGNPGYSHVTFFNSAPIAVPEPSSWALFILGFGALGGAMRRRTRAAFRMRASLA